MSIAKVIEGRDVSVVICNPGDSVQDAAKLLAERRIGALPVLDGGKVVGIFSERDLLYCVAKEGSAALERKIADVMTKPAISVDPSTDALDALSLMTKRRIRHLPVLRGDDLIAFVSIGDLVKHRIELIEQEAQAMRDYITAA